MPRLRLGKGRWWLIAANVRIGSDTTFERGCYMENNMENKVEECCKPGVCPCGHHKIMPVLIVLFGLTFFLGALNILSSNAVAITWPVIIVLAGLAKLKGGMCGCYKKHY